MIRKQFSLLVVALLLLLSNIAFAEEKGTKFGIGLQASFPGYGISGIVDVTDKVSIQGILDFIGDLKMYAGRGIYRFTKKPFWNAYGYGAIGAWSYPYKVLESGKLVKKTETVLGFGAGVGIEYNWQALARELPPLWWNVEVGLGIVKFEKAVYDVSTITLGLGVHYRF